MKTPMSQGKKKKDFPIYLISHGLAVFFARIEKIIRIHTSFFFLGRYKNSDIVARNGERKKKGKRIPL